MISEEKLMAYVDGELTGETQANVEAVLAQNERLQSALERENRLRRKLAELHQPVLEEDVPERLTRLLVPRQVAPTPFRRPNPAHAGRSNPILRSGWWTNVTAIAASVVLGLFLGQTLPGPSGASGAAALVADEQLAHALETQLASSQTSAAPIQIGITFIGPEGQPCRTYEAPTSAGLACRSEGEWQLKLVAPGAQKRSAEYRQAASSSELVMHSAQELLVGQPMNAAQEKQARDAGW